MTTVMPEQDTSNDIVELLAPYEDTDDPETKTHIVSPPENKHIDPSPNATAKGIVETARILRLEVVALCGYKWVPSHNPDKFPACQACFKIAEHIMAAGGE